MNDLFDQRDCIKVCLTISIRRRYKRVEIVFQTETYKIFAINKMMKTSLHFSYSFSSLQKDLYFHYITNIHKNSHHLCTKNEN